MGRATAERLTERGANVAILDLASSEGAIVAKELGVGASFHPCDVTDPDGAERAVQAAVEELGALHIAVNTAGGGISQRTLSKTGPHPLDAFRSVIDLNLIGTFNLNRVQAWHMSRNEPDDGERGVIVNTSSIAARHGGGPGSTLYAASKGFVSTITHGHAKELVGLGIRVNAVSPGVIATPFHERYSTSEQLETMRKTVPMQRLGQAEDCVGAYLFLASAALSGYVTGQIIEVNGGQLMP